MSVNYHPLFLKLAYISLRDMRWELARRQKVKNLIVWLKCTNSLRVHWANSLWPNDAIWHHRIGSKLAQVMVCCLTAPSHCMNQCWRLISEVLWHSPENNFTSCTKVAILKMSWKLLKLLANLQGSSELKRCFLFPLQVSNVIITWRDQTTLRVSHTHED